MNRKTTQTAAETRQPHQANGQSAKGNNAVPGNSFARQQARLRQVMMDAITPEVIHNIIEAIKQKAAEGDIRACKLLLSYRIENYTAALLGLKAIVQSL